MLQGCTAHYLCKSTYEVKAGDRCLIHAAAGGVGLLLIQMVKNAGGFVIGTVSTEEKANLAKSAGADEVILYSEQNFEREVKRFKKASTVYPNSDIWSYMAMPVGRLPNLIQLRWGRKGRYSLLAPHYSITQQTGSH